MDTSIDGNPYLIAPLVDDRHVDVVDEHGHPSSTGRPVRAAHPLVHRALNSALEKRINAKTGLLVDKSDTNI